MLTVAAASACSSTKVDADVVAALRPVCQSLGAPGANVVSTTTQNHVVVLDSAGQDHEWSGAVPDSWSPATLADAELVTCIDAQDRTETIETCSYDGPDITRIRVERTVRVMEARTGRQLASFLVSDDPRTCNATEKMDLTEIRGEVDWPMVQERLENLVARGVFGDAVATSGPIGQATPRLTLHPTVVPGSTPKKTGEPTPPPGGQATPEPTPEPLNDVVELRDALDRGLVSASGKGDGLESLSLTLTSRSSYTIDIEIHIGTVLVPAKRSIQTMVVISDTSVSLEPGQKTTTSLNVLCAQMHDGQPGSRDSFRVRPQTASSNLMKLLRLTEFWDAAARVQQFSIWTITDNPARGTYVPLGSTFDIFGSGPSKAEYRQIRALIVAAGLNPDHYRALK